MAATAEARQLVLAYRAQTAAVRTRVLELVRRSWLALPNYRDADIDRFAAAVVPIVLAAQRQVVNLTDAYLANLTAAVLGGRVRPTGTTALTIEELRGIPAGDVYTRPGIAVWTAIANGSSLTQAVTTGLNRALDLAGTDIQLAKTHASREILRQDDRIVGYRRVLEGSKSCGLCAVAATQRYRTEDLMPIHPGCDCGVQPIFGAADPGQIIDPNRLDGIHQEIADRFGASAGDARGIPGTAIEYRDVLVVHEHGELGPVLAVRGQDFTGPADL